VAIAETIGRESGSTALCYAMHCVGTAVLGAKATEYQKQQYLEPIARGEHITTLALSEPGTGIHFYIPQSRLTAQGDEYRMDGTKSFITNGGHCDSYVVSTRRRTAVERRRVQLRRAGCGHAATWNGRTSGTASACVPTARAR
jgi:alkylation response protein AidB-like acyl-CoA dehydrogenase